MDLRAAVPAHDRDAPNAVNAASAILLEDLASTRRDASFCLCRQGFYAVQTSPQLQPITVDSVLECTGFKAWLAADLVTPLYGLAVEAPTSSRFRGHPNVVGMVLRALLLAHNSRPGIHPGKTSFGSRIPVQGARLRRICSAELVEYGV